MDGCECSHPGRDKKRHECYQNLVSGSEKPPEWCPLRNIDKSIIEKKVDGITVQYDIAKLSK